MIKTFITKTSRDNALAYFLEERLDRENLGLEIFVWEAEMKCGDEAQRMIDEVRASIIYIPILSDDSVGRDFVKAEIATALHTESVNVFPVRINLADSSRLPDGIRIRAHEDGTAEGLICTDFSVREKWEVKYEELRVAIVDRLFELDLYHRDEEFYQDVENIERILARRTPTASEIKIMVNVYLEREKFQQYVFRRLDGRDWLKYLYHYNFFSGSRNPRPVEVPEETGYYHVPYWPALDYLLCLADTLTQVADWDTAESIMRVVRSVSDYRQGGERIDNYHTDRSFVNIMARVPVEALQLEDMERVRTYLVETRWRASDLIAAEIGKSLLPRLLEGGASELAIKLLEVIVSHKTEDGIVQNEPVSLVDPYWLDDILKRNTPGIQQQFPLQAAQVVLCEIEQITAHATWAFNYIRIPAIEDHPHNRFPRSYEDVLVRAARDFLHSAAGRETEAVRPVLHDLLAKDYWIFPRIALNCISGNWTEYAGLFWPLLGGDLLSQVALKHELYELLKANHRRFSDEQMGQVLDWIETRPYFSPPDGFVDEEQERRARAGQKLEWLSALKDTQYRPLREKYDEYLALAGGEPEHPGFSTWMGEVQVGSISPLEVRELLQKENTEIAAYLTAYVDTGEWYGVPSKEGLADAFKAAVTAQPQKFAEDLAPFLQLPPYYLYYLLRGLYEAWKAKHDFDWESLLTFCRKLTLREVFWAGPSRDDQDYPGSLVSQVADLIEGGTQADSHAFDESLLPLTEELLVALLDKAPSQLYEGYDILTAVLNSPKGRVLSAAVNYALRYARVRKDEAGSKRWPPAIKRDFDRRLERGHDETPEFFATAGQYLANLYWLDKEWVIGNIDGLFPKDEEEQWRAAMAGYLWPGKMYRYLFLLLREHGHYTKALETEFDQENLRDRLIQRIVIAYLWGDEQLEDAEGLLGSRLQRRATPDLHKAVRYLWMQRGALEADQRDRVLDLWRRLVGTYTERADLTEEERALVIELSKLASHLDSLNSEAVDWLEESIKQYRTEQDAWFLVKDLHRFVDSNPREVATVYLRMLENEIYPTFDTKDIIPIVENLYEKTETEAADRICNLYGARGIDFLRDVYERHHPDQQDG